MSDLELVDYCELVGMVMLQQFSGMVRPGLGSESTFLAFDIDGMIKCNARLLELLEETREVLMRYVLGGDFEAAEMLAKIDELLLEFGG